MSNITTFKPPAGGVAKALPVVESAEMVAVIASELPPKLADGASLVDWMERTERVVGKHPRVVLAEAIQSIMSTFRFAPTKAEMIDHILTAYQRLGVALSDDAKRHLSFRQKMPDRYALNADGVKRFAEDAKVTLIGYFSVQGPQANLILDAIADSTVEDFEKSIGPVQRSFASRDKDAITGDEVLSRFKREVSTQIAYRNFGDPASHCGGPVAQIASGSKMIALSSIWVALSESFVNRMRDQFPYARCRNNPHSWGDAMKQAFWDASISRELDPKRYGQGLQHDAEALIEKKMAELNREGRMEIERSLKIDAKNALADLATLVAAEAKIKAGEPAMTRINVNGKSVLLDSLENCEVARRMLNTMSGKIEHQMAELGVEK